LKPVANADRPAADQGRRQTQTFRKRSDKPRLSPEQMKRQSDVLHSAWLHFGEALPVIAFLNTRHAGLNAQPLHLAVESAEGLMRVEQLLEEMALKT
jgi:hypothetical protein